VAWDKVYLKERKKTPLSFSLTSPSHKMPILWDFFHKSDEKQIVHTINATAKVALMKNWLEFQYPVTILIRLKKS
jgi:hypothetical protein